MQTADLVFKQVKNIPDAMAREVLDFVSYIKELSERIESSNLMHAQQSSLVKF